MGRPVAYWALTVFCASNINSKHQYRGNRRETRRLLSASFVMVVPPNDHTQPPNQTSERVPGQCPSYLHDKQPLPVISTDPVPAWNFNSASVTKDSQSKKYRSTQCKESWCQHEHEEEQESLPYLKSGGIGVAVPEGLVKCEVDIAGAAFAIVHCVRLRAATQHNQRPQSIRCQDHRQCNACQK